VLVVAVLFRNPSAFIQPADAQVLRYATKVGEIREVPLADGSRMTLDTRTIVSVELRRDFRHVTLQRGRARFAVASSERRPFVVEAGQVRVAGQGTTFDVSLDDGAATIRPIAGSVLVGSSAATAKPSRLSAGQSILVTKAGVSSDVQVDPASGALWPIGRLDFDNTPLDQVVREANRYSSAQIVLGDASMARLRVTGTFRAGDVAGLAHGLEAVLGLRLEQTAAGNFVLFQRPDGALRR
jgi:transmembrane sensor